MAIDSTNTYELVRLIAQRRAPLPFYLSRYFPQVMLSNSAEIHFDEVVEDRRMAPFVSPTVEGVVMADKGFTMKSFRPAYVKPKHIVDPTKPLKRLPGEDFGGTLTPEQRLNAKIVENFMKEDYLITNRLEWMALEALRGGAVTVSGENYPTQTVDYGRDANNTVTLTTTARWNDSAPAPLTDLEDLSTQMATADFGAPAVDVIMDPNAYKDFRANTDVQALLDTTYRGSTSDILRGPVTFDPNEAPMYMGRVGQFNILVDSRQYTDDTGSVVPYLAAGDVLMLSPMVEGVQAYGAIMDMDVMRAMERYPKKWAQDDPSVWVTMTQSAPLPVVARPNASGYIKTRG